MRKLAYSLCVSSLFAASVAVSVARADVPREHDAIISGDVSVSYQHVSAGGESIDLFRIAPTIDYVAVKGMTIGVSLVYEHLGDDNFTSNDVGIIPRIGYAAELGPNVFIWPRVGLGYIRGFTDISNIPVSGASQSTSTNRLVIQVDALLCWSPAPHFFIGAGPVFHADLATVTPGLDFDSDEGGAGASKLTSIGFSSIVSAYF